MPTAQTKIFVCYRRDQIGWTRSIYERLEREFGPENVFMDVEAMVPGQDFEEQIFEALRQCFALVVVIGPDWMRVPEGAERPRLFDRNDYVHLEIFSALAQDITVFPVLVGGARMPSQASLPGNLRSFSRKHARTIPNDDLFDHAMERLIDSLKQARESHHDDISHTSVWAKPAWAAATVAISIAVGFSVNSIANQSDNDMTIDELHLAQQKLSAAEVEIAERQEQIADLEKKLVSAEEKINSQSQKIAALENDKANLFIEKDALEKTIAALKLDLESAKQTIAEPKEVPPVNSASANKGEIIFQTLRGARIHLGDENIDGWSVARGACFEFSSWFSGYVEILNVSYEPYGVETADLIIDSKRFRLHRSDRLNEWYGPITKFINVSSEFTPQSKLKICSNRIEDGDFDDFMLRNVELIVSK